MPPKAHLNDSKRGPPKGIFRPQKCHFPDFPILTSVGGSWDRKAGMINAQRRRDLAFTILHI